MAKTLICITSYNRQESLARLLANLMNDSRPNEVDIMVFNDRSDDGTAELLRYKQLSGLAELFRDKEYSQAKSE